jgi:hypothetical protein
MSTDGPGIRGLRSFSSRTQHPGDPYRHQYIGCSNSRGTYTHPDEPDNQHTHTNPDPNANEHAQPNSHFNCNVNAHPNPNRDVHPGPNRYPDAHGHPHLCSYCCAYVYANPGQSCFSSCD